MRSFLRHGPSRPLASVLARSLLTGSLLAGSLLAPSVPALAQEAFGEFDRTATAQIRFSGPDRGAIEPGGTAEISGRGFKPGQKVTLYYGHNPLGEGALVADERGEIGGSIAIPADAVPGNHPIVAVAEGPYTALVSDLKVSPTIPLSGAEGFAISRAQVARGLYQGGYSAKNDALFVTSSVGRPPVSESEIVRLDGQTLAVEARVTPPPAPAREGPPGTGDGGVFAVYGIGVDDANGTVWVSNTRQDTVAVYRQSDLTLVKQFEPGAVQHARDVLIDEEAGKAFVGATTTPEIIVFDTASMTQSAVIEIEAPGRGSAFSVASLSLDPEKHRLYAVSLDSPFVAVIDTQADEVMNVFPVPGARSAIGVAHDPQTDHIFVAAQETDNLVVLDGESGAVIADTPVGAGALNVAFDPATRRAFVANRGAGTIAVTDADGQLLANLGPARLANHVTLGENGVIYAVDKSATEEGEMDNVWRIAPR